MKTIDKMKRAFILYLKLTDLQRTCEHSRDKGRNGIACANDANAIAWQKLEFRIHLLNCYIRGDRLNWHFAWWLSYEEAEERNKALKL